MSKFSLDDEMNIEVKAGFVKKGSDTPLTDNEYEFRLYEKDLMEDDYLGKSSLDENGVAKVSFKHKDYRDFLNPEKNPDLYFALYKGESLVFQSKVFQIGLIPVDNFKNIIKGRLVFFVAPNQIFTFANNFQVKFLVVHYVNRTLAIIVVFSDSTNAIHLDRSFTLLLFKGFDMRDVLGLHDIDLSRTGNHIFNFTPVT